MHHFFIKQDAYVEIGEKIIIDGENLRHLRQVLRLSPNDKIIVHSTDKRAFVGKIKSISAKNANVVLLDIWSNNSELPCNITLFQGVPKGSKMDWIIQKSVELGIHQIVPVISARAVVKLDEKKAAKKVSRWQTISENAAKQSQRMYIPKVANAVSFQDAVEMARKMDVLLIPYEEATDMEMTRSILSSIKKGQSIAVFIGPEGGFDPEEVKHVTEYNGKELTLGRRILRTETAATVLLSMMLLQLEE